MLIIVPTNSSSSDSSSSDHDQSPDETLFQLNNSLKAAQSRASSLCTNYTQLMRLVLKEEVEAVERDINQIKKGHHKVLEDRYGDASLEWEMKKKRAQTRLIAAENEIDIRFGAMIDAEWSKYKVCCFEMVLMV
jgi:hypothetical protein